MMFLNSPYSKLANFRSDVYNYELVHLLRMVSCVYYRVDTTHRMTNKHHVTQLQIFEENFEVKNIVVMDNSKLSHLNSIPDAIIGSNVGIAGGAMFANVTLYNSEVKATLADRRIRTGLKMFSTILGDNVQIGANAVVGPGAVLEQESVVYPCVRFNGYAPRGTAVKENSY